MLEPIHHRQRPQPQRRKPAQHPPVSRYHTAQCPLAKNTGAHDQTRNACSACAFASGKRKGSSCASRTAANAEPEVPRPRMRVWDQSASAKNECTICFNNVAVIGVADVFSADAQALEVPMSSCMQPITVVKWGCCGSIRLARAVD